MVERYVILKFEDHAEKHIMNVIHTIVDNDCIPDVGSEPNCYVVGHYTTMSALRNAATILAEEEMD